MRMNTLRGWRGGHLEEAPKEGLRLLTPKGTSLRNICVCVDVTQQSDFIVLLLRFCIFAF